MEFQEDKIYTDGGKIFTRNIAPKSMKGVVVLVHGIGEHSGRYIDSVIPTLLNGSLAVVTYDNVGHGKSGGKRGHCPSYGALMGILKRVMERAIALYGDVPLFLYGHSMGGNLVLNYALRNNLRIAGIVATSPYLRLAFKPPKWKMFLGRLMLRSFPMVTLPSGLDAKGISRIPEAVENYSNDPLVHDMVSPMYSFPVMEAGEWAIGNASKLETPTFLLHGTADPIIDYKATEEFHRNSHKTELKLFEGGFHELHHDSCQEALLLSLGNWLKQQIV